MNKNIKENQALMLFCSIVSDGQGSKALHLSKKLGAYGSTVLLGRGIVDDKVLNFLGFTETRKEVLLAIIKENLEQDFFDTLSEKLHFDRPNHGIAFSIRLDYFYKPGELEFLAGRKKEGVSNMEYEAIFVVVDKGAVDDVIDAADTAGATGGTVIHGRGAGKEEKIKLFNIDIEPEKEILIILSQEEKTEDIVEAIRRELQIEEHGKGILFVLDVNQAVGLHDQVE